MAEADLVTIRPGHLGGAIVSFRPGRPHASLKRFRGAFPQARPVANWCWFVPGSRSAQRVARFSAVETRRLASEARHVRAVEAELEWEAAAP